MPFDSAEFARVYSAHALTPGERLGLLLEELRKPYPDWDFRKCDTCAIGIALRLFPEVSVPRSEFWTTYLASFFGVSESRLRELFTKPQTYGRRNHCAVTQADVARGIEKLIDTVYGGRA